ncbi:hypothetical protein L1987_33054 [Smallanthus sonchifolius]|uniref:Uncharacterized protein n=1 Tax=Smallanthus sonchifolius TaxID=185202 RepID=A0ACB9HR67_9ASTR|nr:hypothetical protein L1987_33054 [Smallanthus sonchifolius]
MRKNYSRSTFSGAGTPLFPEMMGVESGDESRSSSSSSSSAHEASDVDNNDNDDGPDEEGENVNDNVEFDHEELHTTQDTSPVMPSWAISLQTHNETSQKAMAELTSLVSTLSLTVQSQDKEIRKLKIENKRLKLSKSSYKPEKFKILVRGPPQNPSYKNFVVSSSISSEDDAVRQGEKEYVDEEVFGHNDGDDAGPSSPFVEKNVDVACPSSPIGENILSSNGSPIKTIAEILRQDELEAKAKADAEISKAAAESLSSILSKKLEESVS